jgi:lipopolysaccharide transport system ATP-binding protein
MYNFLLRLRLNNSPLDVKVKVQAALETFIMGIYICDKNGNEILGSNTKEEDLPVGPLRSGDTAAFRFSFHLPLRPGGYSLTVAGAESYTSTTCDWIDNVCVFKVLPPPSGKIITALVDVPMVVDLKIQGDRVSDSLLAY